jgi:hypothetical protein
MANRWDGGGVAINIAQIYIIYIYKSMKSDCTSLDKNYLIKYIVNPLGFS